MCKLRIDSDICTLSAVLRSNCFSFLEAHKEASSESLMIMRMSNNDNSFVESASEYLLYPSKSIGLPSS